MAAITLTTWNAEWLEFTAGVDLGWVEPGQSTFIGNAPSKLEAKQRIDGLAETIGAIDPGILFLCEGVKGSEHMRAFVAKHLPAYDLITREAGGDAAYGIQGEQWLWFLVKKPLSDRLGPTLLSNETWHAYTAEESALGHSNGRWMVSIPQVKRGEVLANIRDDHSHFRHPQVLAFDWSGTRVEVIGLHLKSKLVTPKPRKRRADESFEAYAKLDDVAAYLAKSHIARIKLTSEATDVRYYVDHRFEQEREPSIIVVGDLNDGPGKELLEREYLFHDLIGNLQGEVFFADRFMNHALFDFPTRLRWTARFEDFLDPDRPEDILLDHILFTQALAGGGSGPLRVPAQGGRVEHEIFERISSLQPGDRPVSDHRPVSVMIVER